MPGALGGQAATASAAADGSGRVVPRQVRDELWPRQRKRIEAACVDMGEPFRLSIEQWAPQCTIVYDKFHIIQHANDAINEVRKAEFFRQGKQKRRLIKGKKRLLMSGRT